MKGRMLVAVVIVQVVTLGSLGLQVTDGAVEAPVLGVHLLVSCAALLGVVWLAWPDEPVNIWPDGPGDAQEEGEAHYEKPCSNTEYCHHSHLWTDDLEINGQKLTWRCPGAYYEKWCDQKEDHEGHLWPDPEFPDEPWRCPGVVSA